MAVDMAIDMAIDMAVDMASADVEDDEPQLRGEVLWFGKDARSLAQPGRAPALW
ncbi:hypothetical protein B0T26DRAFT_756935 [Lasiosphaeria miniovina]|uniref:Uncharacterized protein n=1 Tax=Lasiosphaeria miniovina TaxID=1954250 RepID=A0AA39ZTS2_9PEZI|nr:uncharacterized protein B0T26DRAFT_756935 [Lasiosphaeria miniovina]KAK0703374.1 hypothetical protein B0T26DRAFT_756935 [Lasiosphaeria miniovina]